MKPVIHQETGPCIAISDVLSRIGDKWSVLVIVKLAAGPMRFSELQREIGNISKKMLTTTLRGLERDGFVSRTVTPLRPPRVDYGLTDFGKELNEPLGALAHWAGANHRRMESARAAFDLLQDRASVG
ncbi:winged helix-turn-helix transcriptional regulator [Roseisalinus antarcticus]|uniref:Putative HTH-type transcriptional regulator YtcD n=1 Tax=Roseisalinus antarcticus TaxID=254357 RepID=A0A1Y5SHZ8_9RHOB|nr:helix-turn-helix domain-containing protein [Roseisalinus antarcticus]SLN40093.1 putative HTH-type transcriptional regulator YtcD [Roseisalinus antarcticus]